MNFLAKDKTKNNTFTICQKNTKRRKTLQTSNLFFAKIKFNQKK